jgi:DNA-binding IclR family transcriptional regulator
MANAQVLMHDVAQLKQTILNTAQRVIENLKTIATLCTNAPAFTAHMVEQLDIPVSNAYRIINRLVATGVLRRERKIRG